MSRSRHSRTRRRPRNYMTAAERALEHKVARAKEREALRRNPESLPKVEPRFHRYDLWNWD